MPLSGDEFLRLESLIYRPSSFRPAWLKAWRNEANDVLYLARGLKKKKCRPCELISRAGIVVETGGDAAATACRGTCSHRTLGHIQPRQPAPASL
jgi:hypothetical protein